MMKIDKNDYPKLPDDISEMIRQEVEKHVTAETKKTGFAGKNKFIRYAVAVIAGCLLVGTTVYATSKIISITTEKKGEYGLETKVTVSEDVNSGGTTEKENVDSTDDENTADGTTEVGYDRYELMLEENYVYLDISYMPEDIYVDWPENQATNKLLFWSDIDRDDRHMSFFMWRIHEGIEYIHDDTYVVNTVEFSVDGGTGVLVERDGGANMVYMAYDIGYVLDIFAQPGMTSEELMNIAKGITVTVVSKEEAESANFVNIMEAPAYVPPFENPEEQAPTTWEEVEESYKTRVFKDEFDKVYQVGEEFQIPEQKGQFTSADAASVKVTRVEICDDLSVVDKDVFSAYNGEQPDYIDENGKLKAEIISYCKRGDGVDSLHEEVATETIPVKLVYVEVEYTSETGDADLLFNNNLLLVKEDETGYEIYDRLSPLARDTEYDIARAEYYYNEPMRVYFYNGNDVWEKNHFNNMEAGETRTAAFAYIVREDWLPYMYLDVSGTEFYDYLEEKVLNTGLVDIRQ